MAHTSFIFKAGFWPVSFPAVIRRGGVRRVGGGAVVSSVNMVASLLQRSVRTMQIEQLRLARPSARGLGSLDEPSLQSEPYA
jgi:hypothetical protein